MLNINKSQQLQLVEIRKIVSVDPAWNILTCASQNTDEEMSKLVAVKIVQTMTQLMKSRALKSHALSVRLTQTNSILRSHTETIISHAFEIPCSFSEVPP